MVSNARAASCTVAAKTVVQSKLGQAGLYQGIGQPQDMAAALRWYNQAAAKGNAMARDRLKALAERPQPPST